MADSSAEEQPRPNEAVAPAEDISTQLHRIAAKRRRLGETYRSVSRLLGKGVDEAAPKYRDEVVAPSHFRHAMQRALFGPPASEEQVQAQFNHLVDLEMRTIQYDAHQLIHGAGLVQAYALLDAITKDLILLLGEASPRDWIRFMRTRQITVADLASGADQACESAAKAEAQEFANAPLERRMRRIVDLCGNDLPPSGVPVFRKESGLKVT